MPFPFAAAASALGAVGGWLSSRRQSRTARRNTDRTIAANKEMAEYAYSKDLEQWRRQNEYNNPAAQMQRFKEAGLNPNLVYGQGTPGNAAQMPQYNAPRQDYGYKATAHPGEFAMSHLAGYLDLKQKSAQTDLTQKQVLTEEMRAAMMAAQRYGVLQDNTVKRLEAAIADSIMWRESKDGSKQFQTGKIRDLGDARYNIRKMDASIRIAQNDVEQYRAKLAKQNINPNDHVGFRAAQRLFEILQEIYK